MTLNISTQQQQQLQKDDDVMNQPPTKESFTASSQKRKQAGHNKRTRRKRKNDIDIEDSVGTDTISKTTTSTSSSLSSPLICYVSQGHAKRYERILRRLDYAADSHKDTYRFYYHSYDKDCDGCIYQYKTTPAEGRNLAVKTAVTSTEWNRCRYLVVFDDDVYLLHDDTNEPAKTIEIGRKDDTRTLDSWKELHQMLLSNTTTYPIIVPQTPFDFPSGEIHHTYQSCVDEVFWMIRNDIVDFVYPFSNLAGTTNYWMTNVATFYLMEKCWPAGIWVDYRWKAYNPKHRYDISKSSHYWNATWQKEILIQMLNRDFYDIGPWDQSTLNRPNQQGYKPIHPNNTLLIHRCHVETSPPKEPKNIIDPTCRDLAKNRFQKWIHGDYIP